MPTSEILTDFSPLTINYAFNASNLGFFDSGRKFLGWEIARRDDFIRLFSGVPFPLMNGILDAQFEAKNLEINVAAAVDFFKQREMPFLWWITPLSRPSNLGEVLIAHGLKTDAWTPPVMTMDLSTIDPAMLHEATQRSGVALKCVQRDHDLKTWIKTFDLCFDLPDFVIETFYNLMVPLLVDKANLVNYLATLDDDPVGVSTVFYYAGIAAIYNVGTLSDYRGKGIGTAATLAPLLDARQRGYAIGVLQSTELGYNTYARIGFKKSYEVQMFTWTPEGTSED
ncbi:MAG: GNAT family N-acetyltransferase [Candidatus Hodarchaeales archaeon]|jgi:GNAT superfamily N-acetyltransferase